MLRELTLMPETLDTIAQSLSDAVVNMAEERTRELAIAVVDLGLNPLAAIERGLVDGMNRAGKLFETEEYFIPELLLCSDAMYAGLEVLRPHLPNASEVKKHKIVIGVVAGDTHDIGKNLVKILLDAAGYEVVDLGRDIEPKRFVETAIREGARVIALSTLMTTTMDAMSDVVRLLAEGNLRDRFKVIVGGGPISQAFADRIGADGYAASAPAAVKLVQRLITEPA